ncbi:YadA C-terminal domain-containing protein [Pseudostreptobacillus hongkongensis]|uniref:YadA C-terminal domain-containing protein n=1 Tax=Pseudostreptobacillus hongkongensis TaxID=1162717 RepID=UPI0028D6ADD9|nr:YadA C-terminal domain-containing protein [Pseudostreptobacillus hongkongensis]
MANLPQVSNITGHRFNIATSYGTYAGHHSFALGLSGLNDRGNVVYKLSGSLTSKGNYAFNAGIGYQFDRIGYEYDEISNKFDKTEDRTNNSDRIKVSELELKVKDQDAQIKAQLKNIPKN